MTLLKIIANRLINARYVLWLILAWPAFPLVWDFYEDARHYAEIMHITGVFSIQLLVLTLAITPFMLLTKRWVLTQKISRWLLRRRRYFGVAAFGYAALHVAFYVRDVASLKGIYLEAFDIVFATGWIGFLILIPLALTSNDTSIRGMGTGWKTLQRLIYPAVVVILIHWFFFDFFWDEVLTWAFILGLAKLIHIAYRIRQRQSRYSANAKVRI